MAPRPVFLDVDPTLAEKSLKITSDQDDLERLFPAESEYPSKVVKPSPGFCLKTKEKLSGSKVFINVCKTDAIPAPQDISEAELIDLMQSDEPSSFRVPMSIGNLIPTADKKGEESKQIDVAINLKFYDKIDANDLFKQFFIEVAVEGVSDKYNVDLTEDRIILRNRSCYGNLQMHRIRQREIDEKMAKVNAPVSAIEELRGESSGSGKPKIVTLTSTSFDDGIKRIEPEFRFFKKCGELKFVIGEFKLPNISSSSEISLDVGEDRVMVEAQQKNYFLDKFLPCSIIQDEVVSTFNNSTKILTVTMPINCTT